MNAKNLMERPNRGGVIFLRHAMTGRMLLVAMLVLFCTVIGARADTGDDFARLKKELKQDILEELRGEVMTAESSKVRFQEMKQELKKEILQELRNGLEADKRSDRQSVRILKEEVQRDVLNHFQATTANHPQAVHEPEARFGNVEGQMLHNGVGLAECKVRLVQLLDAGTRLTAPQKGQEFITTTDSNGGFKFESLPVGDYRIKWRLPGDTGWIRRLRDKPDVSVLADRVNKMKEIETAKPLVSR